MANKINTVTGPISPDKLGITLMHEHIQYDYAGWYANTCQKYDKEKARKIALTALNDVTAEGVNTYVDATPNDSGRDPEFLKELSEASGVNIICTTGLYTEGQGGAPYFKFRGGLEDVTDMMHKLFVTELTKGICDFGIKAGIIKVATGLDVITDFEKNILEAAGRAQKDTGVPVITHTEGGTMGPEQVDILVGAGANPKQLSIGHAGGSADLKYHCEILDKGVFLAFDRLGLDADLWMAGPDKFRIGCIVGLIAMGYADQLIFSHDVVLNWPGGDVVLPPEFVGNWYPTHVFKHIIPKLKESGVTDDQIETIMVKNPRRLFEG
jgi:phosphotriesterase-related protein